MLKLLVPVEASEASMHAVEHAMKIERSGAETSIRLLYVYDEPVRLGDVGTRITPEKLEEATRKHADAALAAAETALRDAGIPYERDVRAGQVAQVIAQRAEETGSDEIVMGTHGGGPIADMFMGSVAKKVVHLSKVPVTLVH